MMGSSGRRLLSRGGPPAGLFPETAHESEVVSIDPGDLGVIVSDGITEAIEEDGEAKPLSPFCLTSKAVHDADQTGELYGNAQTKRPCDPSDPSGTRRRVPHRRGLRASAMEAGKTE
jgi:hypothetical protein